MRHGSKAQTSGGKKTETLPHMCEEPWTEHLHIEWTVRAGEVPVLWHCNFLKT